ncbi:DUF1127 domain-containing protein [Benzoatithermus flavus]|uniref:DUF1127 domain-containing protein n=1 Tax=Benzoatithermus flavus TaxID=3108223 RepID=A0ABU8XWN4_9PROT
MLSSNRLLRAWIVPRQYRPRYPGRLAWAAILAETWIERYRQRRALLELSDHVLKDIGISRVEAEREGRKPFWRA